MLFSRRCFYQGLKNVNFSWGEGFINFDNFRHAPAGEKKSGTASRGHPLIYLKEKEFSQRLLPDCSVARRLS